MESQLQWQNNFVCKQTFKTPFLKLMSFLFSLNLSHRIKIQYKLINNHRPLAFRVCGQTLLPSC